MTPALGRGSTVRVLLQFANLEPVPAEASPGGDCAVFVLRVCKLAVIRLLSNDVGEPN